MSFLGGTQFSPEQVNLGLTELAMVLRANNRISSSYFKQKEIYLKTLGNFKTSE